MNGLSPEDLRKFVQNFDSFSGGDTVDFKGSQLEPLEVFKRDAKRAIWWSAMVTVALIYLSRENEQLKAEVNRLSSVAKTFSRIITPRPES